MKRNMGNIGFVMATLGLAMVISFCCQSAAMSRTNPSTQELEGYYQERENALVENAREFLSRKGFSDSGIMLTRVVDESGGRQYTLTVHHGRINKMSEDDREFLMEELQQIIFEDKNSIFFHKFLVNQ